MPIITDPNENNNPQPLSQEPIAPGAQIDTEFEAPSIEHVITELIYQLNGVQQFCLQTKQKMIEHEGYINKINLDNQAMELEIKKLTQIVKDHGLIKEEVVPSESISEGN